MTGSSGSPFSPGGPSTPTSPAPPDGNSTSPIVPATAIPDSNLVLHLGEAGSGAAIVAAATAAIVKIKHNQRDKYEVAQNQNAPEDVDNKTMD